MAIFYKLIAPGDGIIRNCENIIPNSEISFLKFFKISATDIKRIGVHFSIKKVY
jgi:hypothetical protein